ncbi:MAG: hypothetical protein ACHQLA_04415 [Ignavibacteriales bacterium]
MKDLNKIDQKLIDKIVSTAYGDAGIVDRLIVYWKAFQDDRIKMLFQDQKNIATAVQRVKQEETPIHLTQAVKGLTTNEKQAGFLISNIQHLLFILFEKRTIAFALLGIIFAIVISFLIFREPEYTKKYSHAEIELAEKQFKLSLAIIGKAFEKAEKSFSDDILDKQINKKLNKGYYLVNNILIGG